MPKSKAPKKIVLTEEQVKLLETRISNKALTDEDIEVLLSLLNLNLWVQDQLSRAKLTIKKLQGLFGFSRESSKKKNEDMPEDDLVTGDEQETANLPESSEPNHEALENQQLANWDETKNHGRLAAGEYTGAPLIEVPFDEALLLAGKCPDCAKHKTEGKLYPVKPSVLVFLDSDSLISGERYQCQKSRCCVCQRYFTANLPKSVASKTKYSHRCTSSIAVYHYYGGMPFYRLAMLQKAQGVPLSDSTQYDLMQQLYHSVISPVSVVLRRYAANGSTHFFDDTPGRIIEQLILNQQAGTRQAKKAVHATALLSEYQGHQIYLFDTNTQPAGKQLKALFSERTEQTPFLTMSDASASNFPLLEEALMARWVISLCLAHGRRRFVELLSGEQDEDLLFVLELIAKVYSNERHCKKKRLSKQKRLVYHQQHSAPVMAALFTWFNNLLLFKQVEPNSRFGEAICYMLKRWKELTQFLSTPGASLDNNICEQSIKVMIRYRKNSLFYRTFYSATVGDAMMSVLHTAVHAGVNVFDYLNTLQANEALVQATPEDWLPWNYQQTLTDRIKPP